MTTNEKHATRSTRKNLENIYKRIQSNENIKAK